MHIVDVTQAKDTIIESELPFKLLSSSTLQLTPYTLHNIFSQNKTLKIKLLKEKLWLFWIV